VIALVAQRIQDHALGVVNVVGHTDNVGDDAYNQDLSERRAAAVVAALTPLVDTSKYQLVPSGKGETEPVFPNDTEEHRQLNRRVTVTLDTQQVTTTQVEPTTGQLAPFTLGPTGSGSVETGPGLKTPGDSQWTVTAKATRLPNALLLAITTTATQSSAGHDSGELSAGRFYRPGGNAIFPHAGAVGVRVINGSTVAYPLDYTLPVGDPTLTYWYPLADLSTASPSRAVGQSQTSIALYPPITTADTISIELENTFGAGFRLTDVPVTAG
jgi:hypothetical protein